MLATEIHDRIENIWLTGDQNTRENIAIDFLRETLENTSSVELDKLLSISIMDHYVFTTKMVKLIINSGATLGTDKEQLFLISCRHVDPMITRFFLENGVNVNAQDGKALATTFNFCNHEGWLTTAKILLEAGIKIGPKTIISAIDSYVITPELKQKIELLIEHNINPNLILQHAIILLEKNKIKGEIFCQVTRILNTYEPDYSKVFKEQLKNA
jgi:hypothetical protein